MKLNPQHAPLYGECVLTVQLDDGDACCDEGEEEEEATAEFYLLFSGSTQRHLTSTLRVSHDTLQAMCPAHDVCEQVLVTLCLARPGEPLDTHSQETFCFTQDLALDMASYLLESIAPQDALMLDNEQIPSKECERLDRSLALALKHLIRPHQRAGPGPDDELRAEVSTQPDSRTAASQCQQLSRLLHLAAGHGLRTVAEFLLQQPGGREALRRPNARGLTAARLAESRGHGQLAELFTQYETSQNAQAEPKEQRHVHPRGRVFQHHASLGTYTLTFLGLRRRREEGGGEIREEVEELRRRIHLHREETGNSDFAGTVAPTRDPVSPACGLQCHFTSALTRETCGTTTEEQGHPPSLEERAQGGDSAVVTRTSCTSGTLCQRQEARGERRGSPAPNPPAGRSRKNRKRTAKNTRLATESPRRNRNTQEAGGGSAQRLAKAPGSSAETDGTSLPRGPAVASVTGDDDRATETHNRAEETPLPMSLVSAPAGDGKCTGRKAVALPATIIVEKQEGEKWEVDLLKCERVAETETVTQFKQRDTESLPSGEVQVDIAAESGAEKTATMGQEQSQDHQESQSDPEEPGQPDTMDSSPQSGRTTGPKSPETERKPRRVLWRDSGWIGSRMGSPPPGPETIAKTVWYQGEKPDQDADDYCNREQGNSRFSQSVWYDSDTADQREREQLEQVMKEQKECDLSSAQASGLSTPQLLEQPLSFHQLSSALSKPHAVGTQPALPSHGSGGQRREVHESQQKEEVGPDWKEGGVEGDGEEVSNRGATHSRKSSEMADVEEGERQESGDKGAKGRKKRRKKRGRRGGAEAKLSSSSSIESQSQIEIKTQREQVLDPSSQSEAKDTTGREDIEAPTKEAMHLPRQTEGHNRHAHDPDHTNSDPSESTPEISSIDRGRTDLTGVMASQSLETKELSDNDSKSPDSMATASDLQMDIRKADMEATVQPLNEALDPTELELKGLPGLVHPIVDNVDSKELPVNEDSRVAGNAVPSVDRTGLVESNCLKLSDSPEYTDDSSRAEFPEQNTQHEPSVESSKPAQPEDPTGRPHAFLESTRPAEARGLPIEGSTDVLPLEMCEGSTDTTARGYSEHCLAPGIPRDRQHGEEKRNEACVGKEEVGKIRSRSEENDGGMLRGEESSSIEQGQDHNESLVATAVAVVTVAIASAMARIELSQQLADNQPESQEYLNQTPGDSLNTVHSAQLMDRENCPLRPAETENTPIEHSIGGFFIEPTDRFAYKEKDSVDSAVLQCNTETVTLQLTSNLHPYLDPLTIEETPSSPQLTKEEIQIETTQNQIFACTLHEAEDHLPHIISESLSEADETITAEVEGHGCVQVESRQQLSDLVAHLGRHPEASGTFCTGSEENPRPVEHIGPQDQFICKEKSGMQHRLYGDDSPPLESITTEAEVGSQDSPHSFTAIKDISGRECERAPQPGSQTETPHGSSPLTCPILPFASCDSTPVADPSREEPTGPQDAERAEYQSATNMELVPANPIDAGGSKLHSKGQEPDSSANQDSAFGGLEKVSLDAVDGWKEREKNQLKSEAEARNVPVTADITCLMGK
ncbi:uncharacterized protein LOC130196399 [Pseudoliparis swirei]|uniref:uncharacterized protein LOC130196399 n=1 Tax=Pseudoliparis swirei TaxID=2059687 RepID=UPI0024BD91D7|nr:uncharacterized protein LOC130196399 [Pseudoliparis swirei]